MPGQGSGEEAGQMEMFADLAEGRPRSAISNGQLEFQTVSLGFLRKVNATLEYSEHSTLNSQGLCLPQTATQCRCHPGEDGSILQHRIHVI